MEQLIKVIDVLENKLYNANLTLQDNASFIIPTDEDINTNLFISPSWIDMHSHVYHGVTSLGVSPDKVGLSTGVHLLIDAGSSGEATLDGFTGYVAPRFATQIKAFLNISSIGLTTIKEYADVRNLSPIKTAEAALKNKDFIIGIKVRSSGTIVEEKGLIPLIFALEAAELCQMPLMLHIGETPPDNDSILRLLRKGDIISHCFHGKDSPLWNADGTPIPELKKAIERGVILDVAHGAASMDRDVAQSVISTGMANFIISTDIHIRNINSPVYSLPVTMSKFLAMGMKLTDVIRSVTLTPSSAIGLNDWCGSHWTGRNHLIRNATIFKIRDKTQNDPEFIDSKSKLIKSDVIIQPVAVIVDGKYSLLNS